MPNRNHTRYFHFCWFIEALHGFQTTALAPNHEEEPSRLQIEVLRGGGTFLEVRLSARQHCDDIQKQLLKQVRSCAPIPCFAVFVLWPLWAFLPFRQRLVSKRLPRQETSSS